MNEFPWGVFIILSCGLVFTAYVIYYINQMVAEGYAWEYDGGTKKKDFALLEAKRNANRSSI